MPRTSAGTHSYRTDVADGVTNGNQCHTAGLDKNPGISRQ